MENEQSELKRTGLHFLSNTSQCIMEENVLDKEIVKSSSKYSHKKRQFLNQTNGFNSFQLVKGTIPILRESEAKNQPYLNNLNVDSETLYKYRTRNVEEQYEERYRDIAVAESNPIKNDNRAYISKERQPEKGLFDEANGFNIQRFLKRVAEEKLYGTFMQTLKNNDMQGQALNTQRRMQNSLYSPQKSNSSFENNYAFNLKISSNNASPNSTQKHGYNETNYFSNAKIDNYTNRSSLSKRPYSTNQRQAGEWNGNSTFYNLGESQTTRDQLYNSNQSRTKYSKNKLDLSNKSFYGEGKSQIPSFLIGELGSSRKMQGQQSRELTPSLEERRMETPQGKKNIGGIFVSAPMTSLLKRRQRHYPIAGEYDAQQQMNESPSPNLNHTASYQFNKNTSSTDRKLQSSMRNTYFVSDYKKRNANFSIDCDQQYEDQVEESGVRVNHLLAKSLAASPAYRRNEDGPYSQMINRQNSMKKSYNSQMGNTISSNMMTNNKILKQNFSTLKKKNDFQSNKAISANEFKERSLSQQFKIIQDEGSINKGDSQVHHYHIKVNHKDPGFSQIFKKISNAPEQQQVLNIRTTRANFRTYLQKRYHESLVEKLISFLEIPAKVDFMTYIRIIEKILNLTPKQKVVLCFIILDENEDGYICNSDIFSFLRKNQNKLTEIDIKNISRFSQTELNEFVNYSSEDNELEKILIKKANLSLTEYKLYKKKGVDCLIPTTVKKDTLYHVSFQIIEHSNKYRQTVRQLEETKRNQLLDLKKNQNRVCKYVKDASFCINFDQFEMHLSRLDHILYIFFDFLAYVSLLQFSYVDYSSYDRNYYSNFQTYKSEQVEFKSAYARLLKQYEENMVELENQNQSKTQKQAPQIYIEKANIPQKAYLNRTLTHKTTPMNANDKAQDFNVKQL